MKPTKIAGATNCMKAPSNWKYPSTPCEDLFIRCVIKQPDNMPTVTSAWLPTKEELEALNKGCPILLTIITTQPLHPMMLSVGSIIDLEPVIGLSGDKPLPSKLN